MRTLTSNLLHSRLLNVYIFIDFQTETVPNSLISLACSRDRYTYSRQKTGMFKKFILAYITFTGLQRFDSKSLQKNKSQ